MTGEHSHPDLAPGQHSHPEIEQRLAALAATVEGLSARVTAVEQPQQPPAPVQAPMRPIRFASLDEAKAGLSLPTDANYVVWSHGNADLDSVLATLADNDILVLPERDEPYWVESKFGFKVSPSVAKVDGVTWPLTKGNYWFNMARAKRGIVGLGPNTVIKVRPSAFTQGPQPNAPRYRYDSAGVKTEILGAQESIIGFASAKLPYAGNFVMLDTPDFGGVAFDALKFHRGGTAERIYMRGAHRGFQGYPNGETGGVTFLGPYTVRHVEVDCRDANGVRVGTSPVMFNRSPSGGIVEDSYFHHAVKGMPTYWECFGKHVWRRVVSESNAVGVNLEALGRDKAGVIHGFHLLAEDCAFLDPIGSSVPSRHLNMSSPYVSQRIELVRCRVTGGREPGHLIVQTYGTPMLQADADITATRPDGTEWTKKFYR